MHLLLFGIPRVFTPSSSQPSGTTLPLEFSSKKQTVQIKMVKKSLPSEVKKKGEEIATRVTSNDDSLKMNDGATPEKQFSRSIPGTDDPVPKAAVTSKANTGKAKYVQTDLAKQMPESKSLKQIIEETSKQRKETITSSMSQRDYIRYKKTMNYGRMKGVPTPTLAFAYYDLTDIRTVHSVFGMKVIALNPRSPRTVVEIAGLGTGNPYCQKIEDFNGKAYSNRIYRRTEPFFNKFLPEAKTLLNDESAILISMTPASSDAYFRYKSLEVIKRNGMKISDVATVIARFHKTSFNSMILVIEKIHMKNGTVHQVRDFELDKIKS